MTWKCACHVIFLECRDLKYKVFQFLPSLHTYFTFCYFLDFTNWYLLPRYTERNVECSNPEKGDGCALDWCEYTPGMNVYQIFGGIILGTIGYPFCVTITQSIFSKMLGPRPQVRKITIGSLGTVLKFLKTFYVWQCCYQIKCEKLMINYCVI